MAGDVYSGNVRTLGVVSGSDLNNRYSSSRNKWERVSNGRYWMAHDALTRGGASSLDADRLARILAAQSALEAGWEDSVSSNNYAGYMSNGRKMRFSSPEAFWDYHIKNLDEKWPGWRSAQTIDEYYRTVNHPELGLDTQKKFDDYNKAHNDSPVYIYAPEWDNSDYRQNLFNVYNNYINKYVPALEYSNGGKLGRIQLLAKRLQESGKADIVLENRFDGGGTTDEPTLMQLDENGEVIDVLPGAYSVLRDLTPYNRREVKQVAEEDALSGEGLPTLDTRAPWQERVYNRRFEKTLREAQRQQQKRDLFNAAVEELRSGKPTGAFKAHVRQGIESAAPFAMGLVNTAALPALSSLVPLGAAGRGAAKGLEWVGEKAMPSALLKGAAYYLPDVAGEVATVAPYADAAALTYWGYQAAEAARKAEREGKNAEAASYGALSALPLAPAAVGAVGRAKNLLNSVKRLPDVDKSLELQYKLASGISPEELLTSDLISSYADVPFLSASTARKARAAQEASRAAMETSPMNSALNAVIQASAARQAPYVIQDLGGGYMLKSLMRGNPLEKQISKNGTVSVNNVKALINKGSNVEKAVVDKVLASEEFAGKKAIDYNKFRKAVQDELITYERTPDTRWENYGMENLHVNANLDGWTPNRIAAESFIEAHPELNYMSDEQGRIYESIIRDEPGLGKIYEYGKLVDNDVLEKIEPNWFEKFSPKAPELNTFTFSSPRIPNGSAKHYDANTLGHSRTYTTSDEPDVLHVMESQSDWGQGYKKMNLDGEYNQKRINSLERRINNLKESINSETKGLRTEKMNDGSDMSPWFADSLRKQIEKDKQLLGELTVELDMRRNPKLATQQDYLAENYTSRQIQENLRYAAEKGQTKMRYPTRETAAKIEGYPKREVYFDESGKDVTKEKVYTIGEDNEKELKEIEKYIKDYSDKFDIVELPNGDIAPAGWLSDAQYFQYAQAVPRKRAEWEAYHANHPNATAGGEKIQLMEERLKKMTEERQKIKYWNERRKQLKKMEPKLKPGITKKTVYDYEDILRKYADFPKQYKKLYKNADVRIVTDSKGNTWYEVDVPENYLKQEWAYADGGLLNKLSTHYSGDTAKIRELISKVRAKQLV